MKSEKFPFQLFLATFKIVLAASTFWQNICKTLLPQKNICGGVHSYCNSNFKICKWKLKIKTVYSVAYSAAQVFIHSCSQNSHRRYSVKKVFLMFFQMFFHRKTTVSESLFNEVSGLQAWSFIKKRLQHRCVPVNIAKFLRTPILKNIWERLLLT